MNIRCDFMVDLEFGCSWDPALFYTWLLASSHSVETFFY